MKTGEMRYRNQLLIARILAGRYSLELEVSSNVSTAMTDGKKLIYPAQWMLTEDDDMAVVMDGIIDHEAAGHGRHTDFTVRQSSKPLVRRLANIFEDVWCELAAGDKWPGITVNLARTVTVLARWGLFGSVASAGRAGQSPGALLCNAMLVNCRARFLPGQADALGDIAAVAWLAAHDMFGPVWDKAWTLATAAPQLTSTRDASDLAEAVFGLLDLPEPEGKEPSAGGSTPVSGDEPGEQGGGPQQSDSPGVTDSGDPGDPADASDGKASAQSSPSSPSAAVNGGAGEGTEPEASSDSPTRAQVDAARSACAAPDDALPATDLSQMAGKAVSQKQPQLRRVGAVIAPVESKAAEPVPHSWRVLGGRIRNTLASELEIYLEAKVSRHTRRGYSGRDIDTGKLYRLRLGDARVFRQRRDETAINTAVSVLIDVSPSMHLVLGTLDRVKMGADGGTRTGSTDEKETDLIQVSTYDVKRSQIAGGTAAALAEVFELYDIPYEVIAYAKGYNIIKSFDDGWSDVCRRAAVVSLKGNTTATGMAMTVALSRLMLRDEERQLLVVVTDGAAVDPVVTATAYAFARDAEMDVATIFVGNDVRGITATRTILEATGFGRQFSVVNSPNSLAKGVIEAIRNVF